MQLSSQNELFCLCSAQHNEWCKMSNFELGVRVPLMLRVPWFPQAMGQRTTALAELVDLYPTLAELAGEQL